MTKHTGRNSSVRVKTAKGRTHSSTRWLERQLNDPYVQEAKVQGYRSRAAFKLKELHDKVGLIKPGMTVVDLGAAPGGWSQVAAELGASKVIALDLLPIDPIPGVHPMQVDFMRDDAPELLAMAVGEGADIVLSDMAPNTVGHKQTDHIRIMVLAEAAFDFAAEVLKTDGAFVCKVFEGGAQNTLQNALKQAFKKVKNIKPPASRKDSKEMYVVATGFRGVE